MRLLALVSLLGVCGALFSAQELPFKVISISPDAGGLYGTSPLTVVFNRPVIALGSDYDSIPAPPFTLRSKNGIDLTVPFKLRYVTTFIARLDPDIPWPPDLNFELVVNPALKTFDGISLSAAPAPVAYTTPHLGMYLSSVKSATADRLTDGMWAPRVGADIYSEVPPDGEVELHFTFKVDVNLIEKAVRTSPAISLKWSTCSGSTKGSAGSLTEATKLDSSSSTQDTCLKFTTTSSLATGGMYGLTLPRGTIYHPLAGGLNEDLTVAFTGLKPFEFSFSSASSETRFRRLDLWLRHGLKPGVTMDQLRSTMGLIKLPGMQAVQWSLTDPQPFKAVVRINANLEPGAQYQLSFAASSVVVDGFGLPLQSHSVKFNAAALPPYFSSLEDSFVVVEPPQASWQLQAMSQSADPYNNIVREAVFKVPQNAPLPALSRLHYSNSRCNSSACGPLVGQLPGGTLGSPFTVQSISMSTDSALYLRERQGNENAYTGTRFVSVTDLGVTAVGTHVNNDTKLSILVWVVRLSTGMPVSGATVSIFGIRWGENISPQSSGLTTDDGTVEFSFVPSSQSLQMLAYVTLGNEVAVLPSVAFSYSNFELPVTGVLITDLGTYRPGDTIKVKGYIRSLTPTFNDWAISRAPMTLSLRTKDGSWNIPNSSQTIELTVQTDTTFGAFDAELKIPLDADMGVKYINLQNNINTYFVCNAMVVIADPRRPVATLAIETKHEVFIPKTPFTVTVTALTGSGIPISSSKVTVLWTLNRPRPTTWFRWWAPPAPSPPALTGEVQLSTGDDGQANAKLEIAQAVVGDTISVRATAIGPSGEVLNARLSQDFSVRESPWTLDITPTIKDPLPGFSFGVRVDVKTASGLSLLGKDLILGLVRVNGSGVGQECTTTSNGGIVPVCTDLVLDGVGKFALTGKLRDEAGRDVVTTVFLGKTKEEWDTHPLVSFDAINLFLDKESYSVGDTAQVSLQSPFSNAKMLLRWTSNTNRESPKSKIVDLPAPGRFDIPFVVGPECSKSCQLVGIVSVPRQSNLSLPIAVPVSRLFDFQTPRGIVDSLLVYVPDSNRSIDVAVALARKEVQPGETVDGSVAIPLNSGDVEVVVFGVDNAYLQLQPHPLVNLSLDVFNVQQPGASFGVSDSRNFLVYPQGMRDTVTTFSRRAAADPWLQPSWPAHATGFSEVDFTDDQLYSSFTTCLTDFPGWCPSSGFYNQLAGNVYQVFDGADDVFMSTSTRSFEFSSREAAPMAPSEGLAPAAGKAADRFAPPPPLDTGVGPVLPPVRSNFNPSPLFLRRLVIPAGQTSISFKFKLPDDIGTFVVRAYAVTSTHQFGGSETSIISRKSISLEAYLPRITRIGDKFSGGVVLESVNGGESVNVTASTDSQSLILGSSSVAVQTVRGPMRTVFPFTTIALASDSPVTFSVSNNLGIPVDSMLVTLPVLGQQSSVFVATSMALYSQDAGSWNWNEGLALPAATPGSGTLELSLGVGRLPAVNAIAGLLTNMNNYVNGELLIAQAGLRAAFAKYAGVRPAVDIQALYSSAVAQLHVYTTPTEGLRYSKDYINYYSRPNPYLNSMALTFALYLGQAQLDLPGSLTSTWTEALKQELVTRAQESLRYNKRPFEDWDLLAETYLALGPTADLGHSDLSLAKLLGALYRCDISTKITLSLAYVLRGLAPHPALFALNQEIMNLIRIQGRFMYVSVSRSSASAATLITQARALQYMVRQSGNSNLVLEKLANWIASANGNSAGSCFSFGSGAMGFAALSLADYDKIRGNTNPSITVDAKTGDRLLLTGSFQSAADPVVSVSKNWSALPIENGIPSPVQFSGRGKGEVSAALGLNFVPLAISSDPVYRGLFVEKVVRRVAVNGTVYGPGIQLVETGAMVQVCIQITSPDDVRSVVVEDLTCGGLEPQDSNLASLSSYQKPSQSIYGGDVYSPSRNYGEGVGFTGSMYSVPWWFYDPLAGSQQMHKDRVTWEASYLFAGSHSVCYNAIANVPGVYTIPPAKAFSSPEPELMGLSAGGTFVVSEQVVKDVEAEFRRLGVSLTSAFTPKSCGECSSPFQYCNVRYGNCTFYEAYANGQVPEWQPTMLVATPSSAHRSALSFFSIVFILFLAW